MRRVFLQALVCLLCAGAIAPAAVTKKRTSARDRSTAAPYWTPYPQFTDAEVRLVVNWFQDALQEGKERLARLPATVAGQIRVGANLTANVVKSLAVPPADLVAKLPPLPAGFERRLAGPILVIVKTDEALVVDTLPVLQR